VAGAHTGDGGGPGGSSVDQARTDALPSATPGLGGAQAPGPSTQASTSTDCGRGSMTTAKCGAPLLTRDHCRLCVEAERPLTYLRWRHGGCRHEEGPEPKGAEPCRLTGGMRPAERAGKSGCSRRRWAPQERARLEGCEAQGLMGTGKLVRSSAATGRDELIGRRAHAGAR
jgi:hypothetical protein